MTATGPPSPPQGTPRRAPRRWLVLVLVVVVAIVVAAVVADHVDLDYYALTPGTAQPVNPLLHVPAARAHPDRGRILLTDVFVTRVSALGYLADRLNGDAQLVTASSLLGPDTAPGDLVTQGYLEMAQSQAAAKVAALRRLGYQVPEHDAGVVVFGVRPGAPAARALEVGRIVTAVGGVPTPDVCSFLGALATHSPGDTVTLSVEQSHVTPRATIVPGPTVERTVRLGREPGPAHHTPASTGCPGVPRAPTGYLGVVVTTQRDYSLPFPITIRTTRIGGPSAGLAMTLGLVDALSSGRLTGAEPVAVTGTIDPQGDVGEVGGIPQKTVAAERAGARAFLVPAGQRSAALSKATPGFHVYGVSSLHQALAVLRRLGGAVPAAHPGSEERQLSGRAS